MPSRKVTLCNISVDPPMVRVRNVVDINIHFTIPIRIKAWGCIQVRVHGKRRNKNNWYPIQVEHPVKPNYGQLLVDRENHTRDEEAFLPIIESRYATMVTFRLMEDLPAGTPLVFQMRKTTIQSVSESNKEFEILVAKDSIANARPVANNPTMEIKGGMFDHVRILASSNASPGQDIDALIIFEDQFNNPTSLGIPTTASQGSTMTSSIMVQGKSTMIQKEGKLKVMYRENDGATVKVRLPGALLEGIYYNMDVSSNDYIFSWIGFTVHLGDESREKTFWSNPILVHSTRTGEQRESISWGLLHAHSELSDGMFSIDHYFRNIKKNMLAFGASSDHDHLFETTDADFDEIRAAVKRHDDPRGGFVAFLGYEWAKWNKNGDGDKCVYFFDDVKAMLRSGDPAFNRSTKLYAALERFNNKVLIIPHHTAFEGNPCTWEHWDPVHERLVEIYSIWGCSERSVHD
ncbi:hypothetical protein GF325_11590, partial [Candidatus Bathyarchaeota archaeon]|nr:hypothetical protein [Candidatus Bathyarchaeota archaeon]